MKSRLKQFLRDTFMLAVSSIGFAFLYRVYIRKQGPLVRIVVFHDVSDRVWFEAMIQTLRASFNILSPRDFSRGVFHTEKINILITFDDGYRSWEEVALPVLSTHSIKALFFINSLLIDSAADTEAVAAFMRERLLISPKQALSWDGVRRLLSLGHSIGGHARTHADLSTVSEDVRIREVQEDKAIIERTLGVKLLDFAYPFGTLRHVSGAVARVVAEAGYERGYTAVSRFVDVRETFFIPRMCIESGLSSRALRRWVRGSYDLFDMIKQPCAR